MGKYTRGTPQCQQMEAGSWWNECPSVNYCNSLSIPIALKEDRRSCISGFTTRNFLSFVGSVLLVRHTIKQRKANWISRTLCGNCLIKLIVKEKVEVTERRGKRIKQLMGDLNERRRYWKLKGEEFELAF
jgi:hypothetical protein